MSTYRYIPLQNGQTRLLELLTDQDQLTGVIHTRNINDHRLGSVQSPTTSGKPNAGSTPSVEYQALSHHWEHKTDQASPSIVIKHDNQLYNLQIRPGLHDALKSIRNKIRSDQKIRSKQELKLKEKRRLGKRIKPEDAVKPKEWSTFLWVDAICIDQGSKADKAIQLPRMGDIYNEAESVIVWLGPSDDESRAALSFVERLQQQRQLRDSISNYENRDGWKALAMLARRPWFTRLWIVQEITAAKTAVVLVGDDAVSWDAFASALSLFGRQFEEVRTMLRQAGEFSKEEDWLGNIASYGAYMLAEAKGGMLRKRSDGGVAEHARTLEALLTTLSEFQVTQPHDVVYSILWLSSDANSQRKVRLGEHTDFRHRSPNPQEQARYRPMKRKRRTDSTCVDGNIPCDSMPGIVVKKPIPSEVVPLKNPTTVKPSPKTLPIPATRPRSLSDPYLSVPQQAAEQEEADSDTQKKGLGIEIDYDLTVFQLCRQVVEHIIDLTGSLDILCFPWAPPPEDGETHPTWLLSRQRNKYSKKRSPSFKDEVVRRMRADELVGRPGALLHRPYLACGRTKARGRALIEGSQLHVMGYRIATITDVGDPAPNAVIPCSWPGRVGWKDMTEPPPDRYWRMLVGNRGPKGFEDPPPRFKQACIWAYENLDAEENLDLVAVRDDGDKVAVYKEFLDRAIAVTWNRRLIMSSSCSHLRTSDSNLIGLGPQKAAEGDEICILWGCSVPVLLRPIKLAGGAHANGGANGQTSDDEPATLVVNVNGTSIDEYTLVGEAYIDSMMHGECFEYVDQHGISIQDFWIN